MTKMTLEDLGYTIKLERFPVWFKSWRGTPGCRLGPIGTSLLTHRLAQRLSPEGESLGV